MKRQCNLCGLRDDVAGLVSKNKTWCLVFDKEVGNKNSKCEHWKPDTQSIKSQKISIANDIKKSLQGQENETQQNPYDSILLEPVQKNLLLKLVEASRNTPMDKRVKFFVIRSFGGDSLLHPNIPNEQSTVYYGDVEALAIENLISLGFGSQGSPNFDVTPNGFKYYEYIKQQSGESVSRVVKSARNYLATDDFIRLYPAAYEKWCAAENLLWETDSSQQLTLIGHLCREAVQEFADQLIVIHEIADPPKGKAKTVARLKAVIAKKSVTNSSTQKEFFEALIAYWGTVNDLIQRQEHDSLKEQKPLAWEDGRLVVFQTLIVMYEIDRAFST